MARKRAKERVARRGPSESERQVGGGKMLLNPAGYGFVEREDGEPSIFIPPGHAGGAMDGDEVVVTFWSAPRGFEGEVRSVVRRQRTRVTGVLRRHGKSYFVEPDDPRVLGRADVLTKPKVDPGQVVVARIVDYPDPWREDFTVDVERGLGLPGSLSTEVAKILFEHGIDPLMPRPVLRAAKDVPARVRKADREDRVDLRDLDFMTIDPPNARDFDDAVHVQKRRGGFRVHVAVADVSHYVRVGDAFDEEATIRCFSTYLPDRAIPMLPEALSSGICSLVPRKDRLAMVVSFDLDTRGKVGDVEVAAAVIRSRMRLTYDQVATELSGKRRLPPEVRERVLLLRTAADRLHEMRRRRGSIELDLPEVAIMLDEDDPERIRDIVPARSSPEKAAAYNLIEEFMLAANEGVGRLAVKHRLPVIYRVHAPPDEERVERFAALAGLLGVDVEPSRIQNPKGFSAFVRKIAKHPRRTVLNGMLLRSLAQAEYSTDNVGHFALAAPAYLHFTSPIRRYPDLVCHRVLKAYLRRCGGSPGPKPVPRMPDKRRAAEKAARSSERERVSIQAERDSKALFAAAFMRDRIGDRFEGAVTGLSHGGAYVTLDSPPVDGLIRRSLIERESRETYVLDDTGARLVGNKTGRAVTLGDRVIVEVTGVDLSRHQVELALMGRLTA